MHRMPMRLTFSSIKRAPSVKAPEKEHELHRVSFDRAARRIKIAVS